MAKYKYLFFDLDGTLTDSASGIINSVIYGLEKIGEPVPDMEVLLKFIGPPLSYSYREYCGLSEEKTKEAIKGYREVYAVKGLYDNKLYDGIYETLKECVDRGYYLAIASSKPEPFVEEILKYFNIREFFSCVSGAELNGPRGKKEEVIEDAFKFIGIDSDEKRAQTVMIGDRHYDINGAKTFGIDSIGVEYGFADEGELKAAGATYVVETVEDLKKLLIELSE